MCSGSTPASRLWLHAPSAAPPPLHAHGLPAGEPARSNGPPAYAPLGMKQIKLCAGAGHHEYGESAWPGDVFYVFAPVIFAQLTLVAGFVAAGAPPLATAAANPFLTPIEILPEWYLFPAFNVLRVRPSKAAGVASVLALIAALASAPLDAVALGAFAQNPFRRAASCGSCLYVLELALLTSLGAPEEIEFATPWL